MNYYTISSIAHSEKFFKPYLSTIRDYQFQLLYVIKFGKIGSNSIFRWRRDGVVQERVKEQLRG